MYLVRILWWCMFNLLCPFLPIHIYTTTLTISGQFNFNHPLQDHCLSTIKWFSCLRDALLDFQYSMGFYNAKDFKYIFLISTFFFWLLLFTVNMVFIHQMIYPSCKLYVLNLGHSFAISHDCHWIGVIYPIAISYFQHSPWFFFADINVTGSYCITWKCWKMGNTTANLGLWTKL